MKNVLHGVSFTVVALMLTAVNPQRASAQDVNVTGSRPSAPPVERWRENYQFLADPAKRTDFWDPIRSIELGDGVRLQLGGEYRLDYEGFLRNPAFGLSGLKADNYIQQRAMLHADLRLSSSLRVFAQLADTRTWSKQQAFGAADQSRTDIQQLFADATIPTGGNERLTVRVGRQEFGFGAQRLVTVREAPNVRQSFDGGRADYYGTGWNASAFYARPVKVGLSSFDDQADDTIQLWGTYGTVSLYRDGQTATVSSDLYAMGYTNDVARWASGTGGERRYTVGTRLFGSYGGFDANWEFAYQFGDFGRSDIRAYAVATDTGYTMAELPWKPRLGLRFDQASGDQNRTDNTLNSFRPLFGRNGFYTDAGLTTLSNLVAFGPTARVSPLPSLTVQGEILLLRRESGADAVYTAGPRAVAGTTANRSDDIAHVYKFDLAWKATDNLTVAAQYAFYDAGDAIRLAGGHDVSYVTARAGYRF